MRESTRRQLATAGRIILVSVAVGALFGLAVADLPSRRPLATLQGALTGLFISAALVAAEAAMSAGRAARALARLSFLPLLAGKSTVYLALIVAGQQIAARLAPGGRDPAGSGLLRTIIFSAIFSLAVSFVLEVDRMLGQGELARFLRGHYHRPREEERIFLFLDLVGSTALAERIGGIRYFALLDRLYGDVADCVVEHRGEIHKYVGDEAIVTWLPEVGLREARCIACVFAIAARLDRRAASYRAAFGAAPTLRYALHLGPVTSGELGTAKREIAYLGDTVNTTARIVDAARALDHLCVASAALMARVDLPHDIAAEPLGRVALRGKGEPLALVALRRRRAPE